MGALGWDLGEGIVEVREVGKGCGAGCFCINAYGVSVLRMATVGRGDSFHCVVIWVSADDTLLVGNQHYFRAACDKVDGKKVSDPLLPA